MSRPSRDRPLEEAGLSLTMLIGGARSGKTAVAARLAEASGRDVVLIATGEARDDEMAERIRRHREARSDAWDTVEEPLDLEGALGAAPRESCVVVDCLTLWVANLLERGHPAGEIEDRGRTAAGIAAGRDAPTVAVTNEVGSGIVPANRLARAFRDLHGRVNAAWADAAERALLVVAGRILELDRAEMLDDG